MKRWQSLALGVVVSLLTLAYALNGIDLNALRDELARGRYLWLVPSLLVGVLGLTCRSLRWRALLNNALSFRHSFNILNAGYFAGAVLPFRLGEVVRALLAARLNPPISIFTGLTSMVVERLTDTLAVVVLAALAISQAPVPPQVEAAVKLSAVLAVIGLGALTVLAANRGLAHRLVAIAVSILPILKRLNPTHLMDRILDGIAPLSSPRRAGTALLWTVFAWSFSVLQGYVLMAVFYDTPSLNGTLLFIVMASLAVALPAVPGSVGPFEAAVISGLTVAGLVPANAPEARAKALALAVLLHISTTGLYAFLGWLGLTQERVSLGEIVRSAQNLARRQPAQPESRSPEPSDASAH